MNNLSVIIPAYHAEKLIGRTIESLLAENVLPENIIVVEDGVFDNTKDVIERYRVQHIVQPDNKGAPTARNLGLATVNTPYVMFVDSDDFVSNGLIKGLVDKAKVSTADIVFGPWRFDGVNIKPSVLKYPKERSNYDWVFFWLNYGTVPTCSILWRVDKIRSISGWNERLKKNQDGEIAIRAFLNEFSIAVSNVGFSTYWQHKSEFRVSKSHISDRNFTSNIVYKLVYDKCIAECDEYYHLEMGKYCCKEAWICFANNYTEQGNIWIIRAYRHGYTNQGYSSITKFLGRIFGYKYGAKIKSYLLPHAKGVIYK